MRRGVVGWHLRRAFDDARRRESERRLLERFPTARIDPSATIVAPERLELGDNVIVQHNAVIDCGGRDWSGGRGGVRIGSGSVISAGCVLFGAGTIEIGAGFNAGPGSMVFSSQERFEIDPEDPESTHILAPVAIEDDVRLGAGAIVSPGCTLRRRSVLAGNSVLMGDVQELEMWGGTPARKLRDLDQERFRTPSHG